MALGAGNLARGSNANRLRGDGTPTSAFSITSTVPDHRSFRYDISTTYAEGAQLYVLLMFNQQVYPELFGYSFDTVGTDTYKLSANVTIDANGNASINSSINLHQLTNTANTIAFNSPTTITAGVYQQDSSGPNVGADNGVTLKKDTQDEVRVDNNMGNPVGAISTISVSDWDNYFPAAVDEGWDSTDFTHIRIIRSYGATGGNPNNGFFKWSGDNGTFNEPILPSTNKDLPVHVILQGNYLPSAGQYIPLTNIDLYHINSPAVEEIWLGRQFGSARNLALYSGFYNDTYVKYSQGNSGGPVTASSATGTQRQSGYPINPRVPFSSPYPAAEIGFWYPLRGPDGEFITANVT